MLGVCWNNEVRALVSSMRQPDKTAGSAKEELKKIIRSPISLGVGWFLCQLIVGAHSMPFLENLAWSLIDGAVITVVCAILERFWRWPWE
jgi:hypothetical protein